MNEKMLDLNEKMFDLKEKMKTDMDFKFTLKAPMALEMDLEEKLGPLKAQMDLLAPRLAKMDFNFSGLAAPMAFAQSMAGTGMARIRNNGNDDRLYQSGQGDLDSHRWDQALENFSAVAQGGGPRADGALYWKAYTLNRLGRRDEALAAIAELRKSHAGSRWLDDAKALELEVQQAGGKPVSPDQVAEEDLKVLALQGLMQSDPERAFPITENLLKGTQSPKLKRMVVYLLAQNNSPKAEQLLEQIARGSGNPDLQLRAISYMGEKRKEGRGVQVLAEVYAATNDVNVKRAILNSFGNNRDKDHLLQVAKTEKDTNLRLEAIHQLGNFNGQPELWQIYQTETVPEVKRQILQSMYSNGDTAKLVEVAKTEKDADLRRVALQVLASHKNANISDALVAIYNTEQDEKIKRSIVDSLYGQRNAKALVDMARAEKDTKMKLTIVERLSNMAPKSKEAADYLTELLK
jgi:tetratricopeptide (TPR) repeat protein